MDFLTKDLHSFLVRLGYFSNEVSERMQHYAMHLLHLLIVPDENAVMAYFGILGAERKSLAEIAKERSMAEEAMMEHIDTCLRKLAVTPEWQMMNETLKNKR